MRETEKGIFSVSCGFDEWQNTWVKYLDLNRNYRNIFEKEYGKHPFVDKAMNAGHGLRMIFASCIQKGTPIGYPCPFAKRMKEIVEKDLGEQIKLLDYTH